MKNAKRDARDYKALADQAENLAIQAMNRGQRDLARSYETKAGEYYKLLRKLEAGEKN